jgi:hypothetical protein
MMILTSRCLSSVVGVLGSRVSLSGGSVGGVNVGLQNQLNLVDTSVECGRAAGEVVLIGSRRDRDLEADSVVHKKRHALDGGRVGDAGKTRRSGVGNLAHQLAREVSSAGEGVGAVLVTGRTVSSVGLVDSVERSVNCATGSSTLADKIRQKSVFIAKQVNTVGGVEELLSKVADKVVLDEVLLGDDAATSCQNRRGGQSASVDGVQLEVGGPVAHVDVILDIGSISVVDIKRVGLELEDIKHIRQLHVVDSNAADIEDDGGFTGELTGDTESKILVKTSEGKIHGHYCVL